VEKIARLSHLSVSYFLADVFLVEMKFSGLGTFPFGMGLLPIQHHQQW